MKNFSDLIAIGSRAFSKDGFEDNKTLIEWLDRLTKSMGQVLRHHQCSTNQREILQRNDSIVFF